MLPRDEVKVLDAAGVLLKDDHVRDFDAVRDAVLALHEVVRETADLVSRVIPTLLLLLLWLMLALLLISVLLLLRLLSVSVSVWDSDDISDNVGELNDAVLLMVYDTVTVNESVDDNNMGPVCDRPDGAAEREAVPDDGGVELLVSDAAADNVGRECVNDPDNVWPALTPLGTTASPLSTATRLPYSISASTLVFPLLLLMAMPDTTDVVTPDEFA
jgi:hypothetical protein